MSLSMTENISRSAEILRELIRCPSVTPEEGGALSYLEGELARLGFAVERVVFSDDNTPDVENLYARLGSKAPHVMFAGHTDVVPIGNPDDWSSDAFSGEIKDNVMIGRGAVDMKGGIACFLGAVEAYLSKHDLHGSISFLITGDEEGPSINGTDKLLKWAAEKGETWDACIVGEPSNKNEIGDVIKNGRRGSLSGKVIVNGIQGHAAYPHLSDNPVNGLLDLMNSLLESPFDEGTDMFQPTNLEVTSMDVGNPATNVIAAQATASFNIRFNDTWSGESVREEIMRRLNEGANRSTLRRGKPNPVQFEVEWIGRISPVFLTRDDALVNALSSAIHSVTGRKPELSTGGGTSDARFIKDYCPVVEFGLVGQTMHQVDERTPLGDVDTLSAVYGAFLDNYFRQ
jgi:succinyl-diaminopimelate desuccinylase